MLEALASRGASLAPVLAALALSACGKKPGTDPNAFTGLTPATHQSFPIATGPHAVDCASCHGTSSSFKQFECRGCHAQASTAAVHTTTTGYVYESQACFACHADPAAHPFDHQGVSLCAGCHDLGAAYAALPVAGVTHQSTAGSDCSLCHAIASWRALVLPSGLVADPAAAVQVNALVPRYSGTSITGLSPQVESLPMWMNHATTEVDVAGLACGACHAGASAGALYPGRLHSALAALKRPPPTHCGGCHAGSDPTGFVGPAATSPPRSPSSGEMKHDAVAWSAGAPTATKVVTADCGACHLSPTSPLPAGWGIGTGGTAPARFHASLAAAGLPQPASCLDCHANGRPVATLTAASAALAAGLSFDHAVAMGECATCHAGTDTNWSGGRFHLIGSANPASCLPCHQGQRPTSATGWASASYADSPFDYGTNAAGVTHGDGQDCVVCHPGPGSGGAWGGAQSFVGGHFGHGPSTVARATCIACHASQRPDLVLGAAGAASALGGFDHAVSGTGDCIGCHQASVAAGTYLSFYGPGGVFPGGDWKGGQAYPGDQLVSAPSQSVTVTGTSLVRASAGAVVTGMTVTVETLYNAMLHTSTQIPLEVSPGPASAPDSTTCWHCHAHDAAGTVTSFAEGRFHAALDGYSATVGGPVTPLPQPTGRCADCHGQTVPTGIVELAHSTLRPMDHAAVFVGTVTIGGKSVSGVSGLDCSACHRTSGLGWAEGTFHAKIGSAVPADCTACHFPLMADGSIADAWDGSVSHAMSHASAQLPFQACAGCHATALSRSTATPYLSSAWSPGAYHASVPSQPTACVDCHLVSLPSTYSPTQSSWSYALAAGGTGSNSGQWMNHGVAEVAVADCVTCHAADARSSGSAWSTATLFHAAVPSPGTCQGCHGLANGGGAVSGLANNLPAGLTDSRTLTTASANPLTGVPAGALDQITHDDVNVSGHDCAFCHTQAGRSTAAGVQGAEWAQAGFHASFTASEPLVLDWVTGRCSNCHLNLKPGDAYTAQDHTAFTSAAGTQDCASCHSWPGAGGAGAPDWKGGSPAPQVIAVGGFIIPEPPAIDSTTQAELAVLPHPNAASGTSCATCHDGGVGWTRAVGYDHASVLASVACSACHEAGSNLVGTAWNEATAQGSGAGDTRPYTLTTIVARKAAGGDSCTVTSPDHFYPVHCGECHAVPGGTGAVTTGTAYTAAWRFPHNEALMAFDTCTMCHTGPSCPR